MANSLHGQIDPRRPGRAGRLAGQKEAGLVKGAKDERALKVALAAYALVFALKMAVFLATGVLPLLAEACHTFSDILVTGLLLLAAVNSRRATPGGPPFHVGPGAGDRPLPTWPVRTGLRLSRFSPARPIAQDLASSSERGQPD
jgi:hypothetical protein